MRDVLQAAAAKRITDGHGSVPVVEFFDGVKVFPNEIVVDLNAPFPSFFSGSRTMGRAPFVIDEANWKQRIIRQGDRLLRSGERFGSITSMFVTMSGGNNNYLYCLNKYLMVLSGGTLYQPGGGFEHRYGKVLEECRKRNVEAYSLTAKDANPVFTMLLRYQDIHRFKYLFWGGGPITRQIIDLIKAHLADEVYINYGTTETGSVAFADCDETYDREVGCVGRVHNDLEVKIINGLIAIRGATLVPGYIDQGAELNATCFKDGWFYPGDRGHFDADGMLVIDGRAF